MNSEYKKLVKDCADAAIYLNNRRALGGRVEPMYLYHRPSTEKALGELFLIPDDLDAPEGAELTWAEPLRTDTPYDHYFQWIAERATRAPILSFE